MPKVLWTVFNDIILTEETVCSVLKNLDNNKAHGPDEIPARLLTETANQVAPSLCRLFNKSLQRGTLPREWKLANVIPIHKKENKEHVETIDQFLFFHSFQKYWSAAFSLISKNMLSVK